MDVEDYHYLRDMRGPMRGASMLHERRPSFLWDERGRPRDIEWLDVRAALEPLDSQSTFGLLAADFSHMTGGIHLDQTLLTAYSRLTRDATTASDVQLLARTLTIMLAGPHDYRNNAGMCIARLRTADFKHDLARGVAILNELARLNERHARMVVQALDCFFPLDERLVEKRKYMDDLRDTGLLSHRLVTLTHRPKVFLSYGREDGELVRRLRTECLRNGVHAWMDSEQMRGGDLWEDRISRAMAEAAAVVLCFSAATLSRDGYFHTEVDTALQLHKANPKLRIIPATIGACRLPASVSMFHCLEIASENLELAVHGIADSVRGEL